MKTIKYLQLRLLPLSSPIASIVWTSTQFILTHLGRILLEKQYINAIFIYFMYLKFIKTTLIHKMYLFVFSTII